MTKTELISSVAEKTDLTKKNAEAVVNAVIATITDALVLYFMVCISITLFNQKLISNNISPTKKQCAFCKTAISSSTTVLLGNNFLNLQAYYNEEHT